jgi:hypothetical protein
MLMANRTRIMTPSSLLKKRWMLFSISASDIL